MASNILLSPYKLGKLTLPNRLIMAPLTRQRAGEGNVPTKLMAEYYTQRATAGLIISEGTQISPEGIGYYDTPGIHTEEQIKGWKKITKSVHKAGGRIYAQLWHVGRHSHPHYQPDNKPPLAPSAVKEEGFIRSRQGKIETVTPREMDQEDISRTIRDFKRAAENAKKAGFDGIEIHGANGYLIDQFLQNGTNKRTDKYGGPVENRSRFLFEVIEKCMEVWPSNQIGLRLSPSGIKGDMHDSDPVKLFSYVTAELNKFQLAYLHLVEPLIPVDHLPNYLKEVTPFYRKIYKGHLISCGNHDFKKAGEMIHQDRADLVAFGRYFISNPDLVERLRTEAPLNDWDQDTFYGGGEKGYTDYPFYKNKDEGNPSSLTRRYCCKL